MTAPYNAVSADRVLADKVRDMAAQKPQWARRECSAVFTKAQMLALVRAHPQLIGDYLLQDEYFQNRIPNIIDGSATGLHGETLEDLALAAVTALGFCAVGDLLYEKLQAAYAHRRARHPTQESDENLFDVAADLEGHLQ